MVVNLFSLVELYSKRNVYACSPIVVAQMIWSHGSILEIEDIVYTQFHLIRCFGASLSEIVCGVYAPYLEVLAVSVVLVVAFAAATCGAPKRYAEENLWP